MRAALSLLAIALLARVAGAAEATGAIEGAVTDRATGAPVSGVTVTVALDGTTVTARTGADGRYAFRSLRPGRYTILFVFGRAKLRRGPVDVADGATIPVDATIDAMRAGEVITVREKAPESKAAPPAPLEKYGSSPPPYSDEAIDQDVWARAWLLLDLDATGRVTSVTLLEKAGHGLDEIALREAKKYRFRPARDDAGRAIASRVVIYMEWPSYWYARALVSTGQPPCKGSGPLNLGSMHPTYRDCSVVEIPEGAVYIEPADPPVRFFP